MEEYRLTRPQQQIYDAAAFSSNESSTLCGYVLFDSYYDQNTFDRGLNELYRLNDALRVRIHTGEEATQYIEEYKYIKNKFIEFESIDELWKYAEEVASRPFDYSGALCEFIGFFIHNKTGVILKIHHIIADGWSINLMICQLNKFLNGENVHANSYTEYLSNDQKYTMSERYQRDCEYYEEKTKACTEYPLLCNTPSSFSAEQADYQIDESLSNRVALFCQEHNLTPAVFWFTCFSILLGKRMNNAKLFCIGVPVLNRITREDLNTVGMYANCVPITVRLDEEKTFLQTASSIRAEFFSAYRHQKFNFSEFVRMKKDAANKVFDIMVSYLPETEQMPYVSEIRWFFSKKQIESLQINIDENNGTLYYSYLRDVFSRKTIEFFHESVIDTVYKTLDNDSCLLESYETVSEREHDILMSNLVNVSPLPDINNIIEIFENTCNLYPDNSCIFFDGHTLTYKKFRSLILRVDQTIRSKMPGTQNVIGVYCNRGIEMYAAIYAIMRSGNIFLPISPSFPSDYSDYLISNSHAKLILSTAEFVECDFSVPVIDITEILLQEKEPEELPVQYGRLAYIMYTSGSTGKPKGAIIRSDSLLNRIIWMQKRYLLSSNDVILQKTPFSFDVSLWEIFWWGIAGASMAVPASDEHYFPEKIVDRITQYSVTTIHFVPSVFENFLDYLEMNPEAVRKICSLKNIYFSGEALQANTVRRFRKICGTNIKLHNLYGPTECAVDVTYYDIEADEEIIPIGRPIDNISLFILDDKMKPVPIGSMGQLAIGGICVGEGYVDNPEKTSERFIENPFGEGLLYLSGDTVYLREDMNIVFVGRTDKQIKINGQRIDFSIIENAIGQYPGIGSVVVMSDQINDRTVIRAFYSGIHLDNGVLRDYAETKLPHYMIPHFWNYIDELPVTVHGKIDQQKLISLPVNYQQAAANWAPPETELEKAIAELFERVTGKKNVGRYDDFFLLGGTSLDMATVLSDDILSGITVFDFMQYPTPIALSQKKYAEERENKALCSLNRPKNVSEILVVFPYAGGDVSCFSAIVQCINKTFPNVSVMGPSKAVTEDSIVEIADEVIKLSQKYRVRFLSHCAGMAGAASVLAELEKNMNNVVYEYIAVAMIPPSPSRNGRVKNIWNRVPNSVIQRILLSAGMPFTSFEQTQSFVKNFKRDTDFFVSVLSKNTSKKLICPVRILVSVNDLFTKNIRSVEKKWNCYFLNIRDVRLTNDKSHYFNSTNPNEIVEYVLKERSVEEYGR